MQQAVDNVLNGKTALGQAFNGARIPFTKNPDTRTALAHACEQLRHDIGRDLALDNDAALTAFIAKMAAYCAKQGWDTRNKLTRGLDPLRPTLVDALREAPHLLNGKAGIAGILKKHYQTAAQESARLRKELINDPTAPPPALFTIGQHKLVELLTPRHLLKESAVLNHCVGTSYNDVALAHKGLNVGEPGAEDCLTYAIKIRTGQSRLFSLRTPRGMPLATIEYDVAVRRIVQIEGCPRKITANMPFFADLCRALYHLQNEIDLSGGIAGLPLPDEKNTLLLANGTYVPYMSGIPSENILAGTVRLHDAMGKEEVVRLTGCANLTLDITNQSNQWLDEHLSSTIRAGLYTKATTSLVLTQLCQAGKIAAEKVNKLILPALQKSGNIEAESATTLSLPALQQAGDIWAETATVLKMPSLQKAGLIYANRLTTLEAPALRQSETISLFSVTSLSLPALQKVWDIRADNVTELDLPALQEAEDLYLGKVSTLELPALRQAGQIGVSNAEILWLPALECAHHIWAHVATVVELPSLKYVRDILAEEASILELSSLQRGGTIWVNDAETVNIPQGVCHLEPFTPS